MYINPYVFILKVVLLLYMLALNWMHHNIVLHVLNMPAMKLFLLGVIVVASYYDLSLAIILMVLLIMVVILAESKTVAIAKKHVLEKEIIKTEAQKATAPPATIVNAVATVTNTTPVSRTSVPASETVDENSIDTLQPVEGSYYSILPPDLPPGAVPDEAQMAIISNNVIGNETTITGCPL